MAGRFIKLYEQIMSWGWYLDVSTFKLFIHLLLKANYSEGVFQGIKVERGQLVTSLAHLSKETGLTIQQVRTAIDHLISTGEVTTLSYAKFRIITVVKYDDFQSSTRLPTANQQDKQQEVNKQSTSFQQQYKNNIEYIEKELIEKESNNPTGRFAPPTKEEILDYCLEQNLGLDVDRFYDYYSSKGWKVGSSPMKDWKAAARNWDRRDRERQSSVPAQAPAPVKQVPAQQYKQRDYGKEDSEAMQRQIEELRKRGIV
jgi:hypothetical protein